MSNDDQLRSEDAIGRSPDTRVLAVRRSPSPALETLPQVAVTEQASRGALESIRSVHVALRGRYLWVIVLGFLCSAVFGAVTWRLARPIYHSEGLLRIAYTLPEVIQETDQNKPLAQFDMFILSQRMVISSRRILDQAIMDPVWKTMNRPVPQYPDQYFAKNLRVETKPRSEYIQIAVTDYDPATASAAVNSIISAYYEYTTNLSKQTESQRISALETKIAQVNADIKILHDKATAISKDYGTSKLDPFYEIATSRVGKLKAALEELQVAMISAPAGPTTAAVAARAAAAAAASTQPSQLTAELVAMSDPVMRNHLAEQERLEKDLRRYRTLGYEDNHRSVMMAKQELEDVKDRISKYLAFCQELHNTRLAISQENRTGGVPLAGKSLSQLRDLEIKLLKLYTSAKEELAALVKARTELEPIESKLKAQQDDLEHLTKRLGVLQTEQSLGNNRLTIISTGEIPLSPDRDLRPWLGAAAALLGLCLPGLIVFLRYQLARRTYRYSDETESDLQSRIPLLGILPVLGNQGNDDEQAIAAAHSIHQIRVTLRAQSPGSGSSVYLVTSAASGEGKTSVTMSLALSFAASRARTLVIDGDLVGRRFTQNLEATDTQGLHEALEAGTMNRIVLRTKAGVSVLTTGKGSVRDACGIGPEKIRALMAQARLNFDVILIDTGPILGSVEAAVLAQEADSVIFTVSRGQRRTLVEQSLRRLSLLGVRTAGIIFNRAQVSDFNRSPYGSSSSQATSEMFKQKDGEGEAGMTAHARVLGRFGPVVNAMALSVPSLQN
jgi:Mrp family chromosome partitioning ATPase/uncharacterized protein involved in exopolysaccharide biosynthesis